MFSSRGCPSVRVSGRLGAGPGASAKPVGGPRRPLLLSGGRARERGGGTRERSIDMGAPLRGHGRAIGRPGAPFTSTPERHDHAIHFRTAPRRRRPRTRIHPRRDPRHPVDARIRVRTGAADPARPPRRAAQDVPPTGGPGPALRGGGLRRGHHRAPRERRPAPFRRRRAGPRRPAPGDGGRRAGRDEIVDRLILPLVEKAVPEWQAALDALLSLPEIGGPVGYSGG